MNDDNLIFGNANVRYSLGEIALASYKGADCNVKIIREATLEEYVNYLKSMNFEIGAFHGPYYYAAIAD